MTLDGRGHNALSPRITDGAGLGGVPARLCHHPACNAAALATVPLNRIIARPREGIWDLISVLEYKFTYLVQK